MAFRWSQASTTPRQRPAPNSPSGSRTSSAKQRMDIPSPSLWADPPALDEKTAKYVLSVMILLLRHTQAEAPSRGATDASFRHGYQQDAPANVSPDIPDIILGTPDKKKKSRLRHQQSNQSVQSSSPSVSPTLPGPAGSPTYAKTSSSSLNSPSSVRALISTLAGQIVFHVSASNWSVVQHHLRSKIRHLASATEETPDLIDLHVLSYSCLDTPRLISILMGLCICTRRQAYITN
jgi:hypothetical protein